MKKYLTNPINYIILGLTFLLIGFFDTIGNGASSYSEMTWWGKSALLGFMVVLGALMLRFLLIPVGFVIVKGIKKIFNK